MSTTSPTILVLGGTGRTARRLCALLTDAGTTVRTASRSGADVVFDWTDPRTFPAAVSGIDRVFLLKPTTEESSFPAHAAGLLDAAATAGVQHVTYLSAYGMDQVSPTVATRAVELDLLQRKAFTHSIVRPAWFMQNFTEGHLVPIDGVITVPTGDGAEAFVDLDDVAAVVVATLLDPTAHAGAQYAPTGPQALAVAQAAELLSAATGVSVQHHDMDRQAWISASLAAGLPTDYATMLELLTETVASGRGATANDDVQRITGRAPSSFSEFVSRAVRNGVPA